VNWLRRIFPERCLMCRTRRDDPAFHCDRGRSVLLATPLRRDPHVWRRA
jgi:hypothetical protein